MGSLGITEFSIVGRNARAWDRWATAPRAQQVLDAACTPWSMSPAWEWWRARESIFPSLAAQSVINRALTPKLALKPSSDTSYLSLISPYVRIGL